jgi:SPFH domain/Band 7 family protein
VRYKSVEIAPAREEIRCAVRDRLRNELQPFSIDVADLLIDNIDFRPEFKEAIERKQIATQDAQTAQNRVAEAKFKAQQQVETAKGEAQSVLVRAQAQSRANKLLSQSLTDRVIRYEAVQRLAPNVTTLLLPSSSNFLLPADLLQKPQPQKTPDPGIRQPRYSVTRLWSGNTAGVTLTPCSSTRGPRYCPKRSNAACDSQTSSTRQPALSRPGDVHDEPFDRPVGPPLKAGSVYSSADH